LKIRTSKLADIIKKINNRPVIPFNHDTPWLNFREVFSSNDDSVRSSAGFRISSIGTGINRDAKSVEQGEVTSYMLPNNHTSSTYLEFFKTATIKVNDEIMLFNIGIPDK